MSYSITPDKEILKDGEKVGFIEKGIAYMDDPPKGRGIASFRALAGMPNLKFEAIKQPNPIIEIEPEPSAPDLPEPPNDPYLGDKNPIWQRWFVAVHGEDAFKSRWPHRQLPQ